MVHAVVWWVSLGVIQHHPIAILLAIFDSQIAPKLDAQLNYAKRIRVLNHHNFSDYLLYKVRRRTSRAAALPADRRPHGLKGSLCVLWLVTVRACGRWHHVTCTSRLTGGYTATARCSWSSPASRMACTPPSR